MGAGSDNLDSIVSCGFLVRDSYGLVLNGQVKFTSHFSVEGFFHTMTEWKVVSAEIPLHFMPWLPVHPKKHTDPFH